MEKEDRLIKEIEALKEANQSLAQEVYSLKNKDEPTDLSIPVMEIEDLQKGFRVFQIQGNKINNPEAPEGSAYVRAKMLISPLPAQELHLCIDTGANFTICSDTFLITHFGAQVIKQVRSDEKLPRLRSATGHKLKMLGYIYANFTLGTYQFDFQVLVYQHKENTFLLGNDCFFDRLTYNSGRTISFIEPGHDPVPIEYFRPLEKARVVEAFFLAPKSSRATQVQVAHPQQLVGRSVMVIPDQQEDTLLRFESTVSTIQPDGSGLIWVSNDSEEPLQIDSDKLIASIHLVTEVQGVTSDNNEADTSESSTDKSDELSLENVWPFNAMKQLKDSFPAAIKLKDNSDYLETCSTIPPSTENADSNNGDCDILINGKGIKIDTVFAKAAANSLATNTDSSISSDSASSSASALSATPYTTSSHTTNPETVEDGDGISFTQGTLAEARLSLDHPKDKTGLVNQDSASRENISRFTACHEPVDDIGFTDQGPVPRVSTTESDPNGTWSFRSDEEGSVARHRGWPLDTAPQSRELQVTMSPGISDNAESKLKESGSLSLEGNKTSHTRPRIADRGLHEPTETFQYPCHKCTWPNDMITSGTKVYSSTRCADQRIRQYDPDQVTW